jgi:hypothetical protein
MIKYWMLEGRWYVKGMTPLVVSLTAQVQSIQLIINSKEAKWSL